VESSMWSEISDEIVTIFSESVKLKVTG